MSKRSMMYSLGLVVLAICSATAMADEDGDAAEKESVWVTSIAPIGGTDQFVAATADGLLLREAGVYSFPAANPEDRTLIYSHPAAVWCVTATKDGKRVASVDYRGNLVVFDRESSDHRLHEKGLERWCQAMILSPDDKSIVAGNEAGKVMVWDLDAGKVTRSAELDGHAVTGLAFAPDGKQLAASDGGGHIHLLKWPSLESIGKIEVSKEAVWCVAFIDDDHVLVGGSDRKLYESEAKPDAKPEVVAKGTDWITQLAVSPSGQVAAAEVGGRLHFPSTGGTDSMEASSGVWALCWNGDAQLFAGTRKDGIVMAGRSWKWTEPQPVKEEPAEDSEPETDDSKPAEETPAESEPESKADAEKPAAETPEPSKPDAEAVKQDGESADNSEKKE